MSGLPERPAGIPGSELTGPWPVGHYAARLRARLREFTRVQVFGEVFGFKAGRAKVWFELGDATGALADLDEALRRAPDDAEGYAYRGLLRRDLGDHSGALADLQTAARLALAAGDTALYQQVQRFLQNPD